MDNKTAGFVCCRPFALSWLLDDLSAARRQARMHRATRSADSKLSVAEKARKDEVSSDHFHSVCFVVSPFSMLDCM